MTDQLWCGFLTKPTETSTLATIPGALQLSKVPLVLVRAPEQPKPAAGIAGFAPLGQIGGEIVVALDTFARIEAENATVHHVNGWPAEDVGYPVLSINKDGRHEVSLDTSVHLPTRGPVVTAVNMSLGPKDPETPFVPLDPVAYALGAVSSSLLPVLSAGNEGQRSTGRETMSSWAEAPWVLAVGATADPAGLQLAMYSSVGTPNIPDSGPDLVSYGASELDYTVVGTSFAAPRVSRSAAVASSAMRTLAHFVTKSRGGVLEGIPISGVAYIDAVMHPVDEPWPMRALPAAGVDEDNLASALAALDKLGVAVDVQVSPSVLRQLLFWAARPMSYPQYEVGQGFVDYNTLEAFLTSFSAAHLAWLFGTPRLGTAQLSSLAELRLFDGRVLADLYSVWRQATATWAWDYAEKRFRDIDRTYFDPATGKRGVG